MGFHGKLQVPMRFVLVVARLLVERCLYTHCHHFTGLCSQSETTD